MNAPWALLAGFRKELDHFFHRVAPQTEPHGSAEMPFSPAIELVVREDGCLLRAELPGVTHDDIEITVRNNLLHLRGQKADQQFERTVLLPEAVDDCSVSAQFVNGVLEIDLSLPLCRSAPA